METVVSQLGVFDSLEKFIKIKEKIIEYISNYNTYSKKLDNKSSSIEDGNEKEKHYLEMYHTKIMENLIEQLNTDLDIKKPIDRSDSPRVSGGSRKRLLKKSIRKTLRKTSHK